MIDNAEFTTKQEELLSEIPKEFRPFVIQLAWDLGHSSGLNEVISYTMQMGYCD